MTKRALNTTICSVKCSLMKLKIFKIHEKGLKRFFGPLEAEIMLIVWNENNVTIKKVQTLL